VIETVAVPSKLETKNIYRYLDWLALDTVHGADPAIVASARQLHAVALV
jgi:hypothetical protein